MIRTSDQHFRNNTTSPTSSHRSTSEKGNPVIRLMILMMLMFDAPCQAKDWIVYEGKSGPGNGKHVVLLSGDEEYRSEEGLPMLAKILSQRHGFKCSVLFSVDDEGVIDPNDQTSLAGAESLESADAIVMLLIRYDQWPQPTDRHRGTTRAA